MYHRLIRFLLRHGWGEPDPDEETMRMMAWFLMPLLAAFTVLILWQGGVYGLW